MSGVKVLYVISVRSNGSVGGHAYSLDHITSQFVNSKLEFEIISIGLNEVTLYENNPHYFGNFYFNGKNYYKFLINIKQYLKLNHFDIIHCFDKDCYNILKSIRCFRKYKFVLNKCGGANLNFYPIAERIIVFSKENLDWFKKQRKFNRTILHLIPNRVNKNKLTLKTKRKVPESNSFVFVRISRISEYYFKSLIGSIDLIRSLNEKGHDVKFYIIGSIQDEIVYNRLIKYCDGSENIKLLTNAEYTVNASKMLYLADAVIGTGRSVMEASYLNLPTLTTAENLNYPVLLTKDNFDDFFYNNFSGRTVYPNAKSNISSIEKLILDQKYYSDSTSFMRNVFEKYFNVELAKVKYLDIYDEVLNSKFKVPFYYDLIKKMRTIRSFYIISQSLPK